MVEYNTINGELSDSQPNKLKSSVKNKQGTTLRMSARMFVQIIYLVNCY